MAANLFYSPFTPAFDFNGRISPGSTLTFYLTETLDLQPIYTDTSLSIPSPNPVESNSAAVFPAVYLDPKIAYRVVLRSREGIVLGERDPVQVDSSETIKAPEVGSGADLVGFKYDTSEWSPPINVGIILREQPSIYAIGGAVGDGTDESDRVQYAVDVAREKGIELTTSPEAVYGLSKTIELTTAANGQRPVRIAGLGPKGALLAALNDGDYRSTFRRLPGFSDPIFRALGRGVELDGITLDGAGLPGHGLVINRGFEFHINRFRVLNTLGYGILGRALSNCSFRDTFIDQCGLYGTCTDGSMTSGSTTFTSASSSFGPQHIGAIVTVPGAGPVGAPLNGRLISRIEEVLSSTSVRLRGASLADVSGVSAEWSAYAFRKTGNSNYEFVSNTTELYNVHIERSRAGALDLGWGNDNDSYVEFSKIFGLHVEQATAGGTIGTLSPLPAVRIGNVRGCDFLGGFVYGGSGPLVHYEKFRDASASGMDGFGFHGTNFLGYLESHAVVPGKTPARHIDLVNGNRVKIIGCDFDTAMSEHIRIGSTMSPFVTIAGNTNRSRTGSTTVNVLDNRTNNETARRPTSLIGFESEGLSKVYSSAAAAILRVSSDTGFTGQVRFQQNAVDRWDTGLSTGGNYTITWRDSSGVNQGDVVSIDQSTGVVSIGQGSASTRIRLNSRAVTTAPSAGGAGALPATPKGYLDVNINGVPSYIPYY